jgi:hypothetical protein
MPRPPPGQLCAGGQDADRVLNQCPGGPRPSAEPGGGSISGAWAWNPLSPLPITSSRMGHLWDALSHAYDELEFGRAVHHRAQVLIQHHDQAARHADPPPGPAARTPARRAATTAARTPPAPRRPRLRARPPPPLRRAPGSPGSRIVDIHRTDHRMEVAARADPVLAGLSPVEVALDGRHPAGQVTSQARDRELL